MSTRDASTISAEMRTALYRGDRGSFAALAREANDLAYVVSEDTSYRGTYNAGMMAGIAALADHVLWHCDIAAPGEGAA